MRLPNDVGLTRRADLWVESIGPSVLAMEPDTCTLHLLAPPCSDLWRLCEDARPLGDVLELFERLHPKTPRADARLLLRTLIARGLVIPSLRLQA